MLCLQVLVDDVGKQLVRHVGLVNRDRHVVGVAQGLDPDHAAARRKIQRPGHHGLGRHHLQAQQLGPDLHALFFGLVEEAGQPRMVALQVGEGHESAHAVAPVEQALIHQVLDALPDRHPADAELGRQLVLGGQPLAPLQQAPGDLVPQRLADPHVHRYAASPR